MNELLLLVPEVPASNAPQVATQVRAVKGAALRLGLLVNSKANADHLLRLIGEQARKASPHPLTLALALKKADGTPARRVQDLRT